MKINKISIYRNVPRFFRCMEIFFSYIENHFFQCTDPENGSRSWNRIQILDADPGLIEPGYRYRSWKRIQLLESDPDSGYGSRSYRLWIRIQILKTDPDIIEWWTITYVCPHPNDDFFFNFGNILKNKPAACSRKFFFAWKLFVGKNFTKFLELSCFFGEIPAISGFFITFLLR